MTTSADAAIRYRALDGTIEVALIEWKFSEDYTSELSPDRHGTRTARYQHLVDDVRSPIALGDVPFQDLLVEPFYQLMRQQLLAWRMQEAGELAADRVRVVHISPGNNDAFAGSLQRDSMRRLGHTVYAAWGALLRDPADFVAMDSRRLIPVVDEVHGGEYAARYTVESASPH